MLVPMFFSIYFREAEWIAFLVSALLTIIVGGLLILYFRNNEEVRHREGFAIVTFGWFLASFFGSLPYLLTGTFHKFTDAFFESASGFTTTGASVIIDIELITNGILLWRSLTNWLGGMGIVVLFVALLSILGSDAMQIFKAEIPGPVPEKIKPRIHETARVLWMTYIALTVILFFLLWLFGMNFFDAITHTFSTIATGGFSTKNASIEAFTSPVLHWIIIIFMFLGGANFALFYQALKGKSLKVFWKNEEFLFYFGIILLAVLLVSANLFFSNQAVSFTDIVFQAVSMTSTGYSTVDLNLWPVFAQMVLIGLMFVGGCSSSTGGSIKVGRHLALLKYTALEFKRLIHPRAVITLKLNHKPLPINTIISIYQFFFLYMFFSVMGVLALGFFGIDFLTSVYAVAASLSNVGAGLGTISTTGSLAYLSNPVKLILVFLMFLGRLELYTILVLFLPTTWRK